MLTVKSTAGGFSVTNGGQRVELKERAVNLAEFTVDKPGEFEANGIEVVYGDAAALLVWDKLQIVYVFELNKPTSFEKSQFSPCDVLIVAESIGKLPKSVFNELLELYDPKQVIVGGSSDRSELGTLISSEPADAVKLGVQQLPEEGRNFAVLS